MATIITMNTAAGGAIGAVVGFCIGGPAGAAAVAPIVAGIGTQVGLLAFGAKSIKEIFEKTVEKTMDKALSIIDNTSKYLLGWGVIASTYWGASKHLERSCQSNPENGICAFSQYIDLSLMAISASSVVLFIALKSIFNTKPNQNLTQPFKTEQPLPAQKNLIESSTSCNPINILAKAGPLSFTSNSQDGIKLKCC
jgi:hypothetical protein